MTIIAIVLLIVIFRKHSKRLDILMKVFLSFAFVWNAIIFFLIYAEPSAFSYLGAILFIFIAILFTLDIFMKKIEFSFPSTNNIKFLTIIFILLVFLYPIIGYAFGHVFPETCTPMMPCPLTVYAITILVAATPRVDKKVFVALLPWALLGLPKCLGVNDCFEDCILFLAGIYGLIILIKEWRNI